MERTLPRTTLLMAALAFIGLGDASYLTLHYYFGTPLVCGPFSGCETVTSSIYAQIGNIPVAAFGVIFYAIMFFGTLIAWEFQSKKIFTAMCLFSLGGLGASLWFVFVMAALLKAWCTYCILSATTSTLIFVLSMYGLYTTNLRSRPVITRNLPGSA